ncbi:MAG: cation diffusion facilitator family transporter [Gammaproteobacteria bacterium]
MEIEHRQRIIKKVTLVGALVNCLLAGSQILFGIIGQSQALLADGFHTLSDLGTDMIVLVAVRHSSKAADEDHPYGHGRIETLASVILGIILIGVGLGIAYRGIDSILSPRGANPETITIAFAGLAIISKEFLYRYTIRAAKQCHSTLLESNAWHHRSDALSSIIVMVGISAQISGIPHMDAVAAVLVAVMISFMGYRLTRKALNELIDTSLDLDLVEGVNALMANDESVLAVHSLRTRSMGGQGYIDAELRVNPRLTVSEAHYIAFSLEQQIKTNFPQIIDVGIHIDPFTESDHDSVTNLPSRGDLIEKLHAAWETIPCAGQIESIHLHYLKDQVDVDIALPEKCGGEDQKNQIDQLVQQAQQLFNIGRVRVFFSRIS